MVAASIKKEETDDFFEYKLMASITNTGHTMCDTYKLNFYINNPFSVIFHMKREEGSHGRQNKKVPTQS